jgi:Helix-turn-helix domain
MAELVPIKYLAGPKESNPGQAKPGPDSQPAIIARHAAIHYVRRLTVAPDGSRITSTENNIAMLLAQHFNPDVGIAWPSVKTLAKESCISERHCRRNLASLERKTVIQRVPMRRDGKGGQTSNEYFFPALGIPPQTPEAKARRLEIQKVSRTPMTPMTRRSGQMGPAAADTSVRASRTNTTGGPGRGRPPIESLGNCSSDLQPDSPSEAPAARGRVASLQPAKSPKTLSKREEASIADLGLAGTAWNSAIEKVRAAYGANDFKKYRFRDVTVASADEDGAGTLHLTLRSPAPEKAEAGIAKYETMISQALRGFYGRAVKPRVIGHEPASAPPDQPPKIK